MAGGIKMFRSEYAERMLTRLAFALKKQGFTRWRCKILVSKKWHFSLQYYYDGVEEQIDIISENRQNQRVYWESGKITQSVGLRRFDILFAALTDQMIADLKHDGSLKITRKKLNERYLVTSPYFWSKIEHYLNKKEQQMSLYRLFGDEKYRIRERRIEEAIAAYIEDKRSFIIETKKALS